MASGGPKGSPHGNHALHAVVSCSRRGPSTISLRSYHCQRAREDRARTIPVDLRIGAPAFSPRGLAPEYGVKKETITKKFGIAEKGTPWYM